METINTILRLIIILLIITRYLYWFHKETKDNKKKKRTKPITIFQRLQKFFLGSLGIFLLIQLFGYKFLPYNVHIFFELLGFLMIVIAHIILFKARYDLGENWIHAAEFQIKNNHSLVTSGIYSYIRHPIYLGICMTFIGVELFVSSYLVILLIFTLPLYSYFQAVKEEAILEGQFKKNFYSYKKNSWMFIPYIF